MTHAPLVLGINTVYHETAACLVRRGRVVAFVEQERLNRFKHGKPARVDNPDELPVEAIEHCLERAGVSWSQVDRVAVSFDPSLRVAPPKEETRAGDWGSPDGEATFLHRVRKMPARLSQLACRDMESRWVWVPHERAHAASAYFASPWSESAVLTVDGIGESATALLAHGEGARLRELDSIAYPNSLGFLWEKLTRFLGYGEYEAGKVMALAAFGRPGDLRGALAELVAVGDGTFELAHEQLRFRDEGFGPLEGRFGPARERDQVLRPRHAAVAAALQATTEEILFCLARRLRDETGSPRLCLAGGVMLNCVALGRLLAEGPFEEIFVQPVAHDAGTALGAALAVHHEETGEARHWSMESPYLGPEYDEPAMESACAEAGLAFRRSAGPGAEAARAIAAGEVIGWFQGPAEAGPRALGNRSILADPRTAASKDRINLKAKHREFYRPFAPAVLAERAHEWFEIPRSSPSLRTMSFALPVRVERRHRVQGIVHVDGTGRLQVVERRLNPAFHGLIDAFQAETGVPLVINTSFNRWDEPIVSSPRDAVRTFLRSDLDRLFLGRLVAGNPREASRGPRA